MPRRSITRPARSRKTSSPTPKADRPFAPGYGIVGPKDGNGLLPWTWVTEKMTACRTFWLATVDSGSGHPHVMPIWGVWLDNSFYFSTGHKSRKGQNLAANPACTVANDDGVEAVIVEGITDTVGDPAELERVASSYKNKYKMDPRSMNEPIYRVRPNRVFGLMEKTFPKSATRWKL